MRVLVIGAGGVGMAVARTAARWRLFERVVVADYDGERAKHAAAAGGTVSSVTALTRATPRPSRS